MSEDAHVPPTPDAVRPAADGAGDDEQASGASRSRNTGASDGDGVNDGGHGASDGGNGADGNDGASQDKDPRAGRDPSAAGAAKANDGTDDGEEAAGRGDGDAERRGDGGSRRSGSGGEGSGGDGSEVQVLRDRLTRALADYDNLQKRVARDAALERERVKARVLDSFLQVYEYGKMAEFEAQRNPGPLAEGVKMMVREFDRMLEAEGLRMLGQVGDPFDPRLHEAVAQEAAHGVAAGHVSRVVAPGYRLGERVLRYAKVAVAPDGEEE